MKRRIAALIGVLGAIWIGYAVWDATRVPDEWCLLCDGDHLTIEHGAIEGW